MCNAVLLTFVMLAQATPLPPTTQPTTINLPPIDPVHPVISLIQQLAYLLLTCVLAPAIILYVRSHVRNQNAQALQASITTRTTALQSSITLHESVARYINQRVHAVAEKNFPVLAKAIVAGQYKTPEQVRAYLRQWSDFVFDDVVNAYKKRSMDIVSMLGEDTIRADIETAANNVSPFPGVETSTAILKEGEAQKILDLGVDGFRNQFHPFPF